MNNIDNQIKKTFKQKLPNAPQDIWFTRKIMNRLPERKSHASYIEYAGFLLAAIVVCYFWKEIATFILESATITYNNIFVYITILATTFALVIGFIKSQLSKP